MSRVRGSSNQVENFFASYSSTRGGSNEMIPFSDFNYASDHLG